jgi:penicillin amidase
VPLVRPVIVAAFALAALGASSAPANAPVAGSSDVTLALPGMTAAVRIVTDRWGIPHLRAQNLADLYLAWGFVTARDRLWQLEESRRAARGTLWEWLGNSTLRDDGGAQLFELGARADHIWERERRNPAVRVALERYSAGVNAWIARCRSGAEPWPREFARLGRTPPEWAPADCLVLLLGMGITLDLDVPELRERAEIERDGLARTTARRRFESQWIYDTIPDSAARRSGRRTHGQAACSPAPPPRGATAPITPGAPGDGRAGRVAVAPVRAGGAPDLPPALLARHDDDDGDSRASNVFAVGPGRSASGAAQFANDPHLALATPGAFHVLHVSVPGIVDAIGAAVPGLPAIVSGRNAACAWGVTALSADVVDLYADTLSADGRKVRWNGGWAPVREAPYRLRFRVLGIPLPALGQVRRYTPHGPVVVLDRGHHVALSLRWSAFESDRVTLARMIGLERSRSSAEVAERCRSLVTPTLNVVAADRGGDVLYQACGLVPRRRYEAAPGPLAGDGRHEWSGFIPAADMPAWHAPRSGFVVNANNRPERRSLTDAWPRYDWPHDRAMRIAQRLDGDPSVTLADLRSVQNDVFARAAERMVPRLLACADSLPERLTPRMRAALDTLRRWDYAARRSRVAPTLFRAWNGAFLRRSRLEGLPGLAAAALDGRAPEALRAPGREAPERAAVAAVAALDSALARLETLLGPDLTTWRWGRAHRARFRHALDGVVSARGAPWEPGRVGVDGDGSSPAVAGSRLPWSMDVTHGPAFRHLVDLAVADSSLGVIPPANSFYRRDGPADDLLAAWANHAYVPFLLAWPRIEAERAGVTTLEPAGR